MPTSAFRRRALDTSYWVLAIVVLAVYCGVRGYRDHEPRYPAHRSASAFLPAAAPIGDGATATIAAGRDESRN